MAIAALVVLTACGSSGGSDEPTSRRTAAAATPTVTATTPIVAERPKDDRSDAGAIDFSAFVVNRIVGVLGGADVDDVLTLATPDCSGCVQLAQNMKKDAGVVQRLEGPLTISGAEVIDTGQKVDTLTKTRLTFRVLAVWKDDRWLIGDYSTKKAGR